jgi:hypothetical protein
LPAPAGPVTNIAKAYSLFVVGFCLANCKGDEFSCSLTSKLSFASSLKVNTYVAVKTSNATSVPHLAYFFSPETIDCHDPHASAAITESPLQSHQQLSEFKTFSCCSSRERVQPLVSVRKRNGIGSGSSGISVSEAASSTSFVAGY